MVRGSITRLVSAAGAVAVAVALTVGVAPGAAQAGPVVALAAPAVALAAPVTREAPKPPKPAKPTAVQVTGKGIAEPIVIEQVEAPKLYALLLNEVSWLASATPQTSAPKSARLGAKYTVTVLVKNSASQVYDLYPLAAGGPRAYRPAKQPSGKKTAGWFYGRLTMSESLRLSGAPLEAKPDVVGGGIGGGIGEDLTAEVDPVESMNEVFTEVRRLFLLNGAVLLVIMVGLAGMAFLIRRRI